MANGSSDGDPDLLRTVNSFDRVLRLLRRLTTPDGLSLTAASTLYRLDEFGAHRLSDLAVAEGVTQPGMTQLVSRLQRDGLAERRATRPTAGWSSSRSPPPGANWCSAAVRPAPRSSPNCSPTSRPTSGRRWSPRCRYWTDSPDEHPHSEQGQVT